MTFRCCLPDRDVIVLKTVDEAPFELEVVVEELAPCQLSRNEQLQKETKEVDAKIEQLLSTPNTEVVYNGLFTTAVEVTEQIQNIITNATAAPAPQYTLPGQTNALPPPASNVPQQPVPGQSIVLQQQSPGNANIPQSYQLVMDPRLGVIVGTVSTANASANTPPLQLYQPKVTMAATASPATSNEQPPTMKTRRGTILRQVPNAPLPPLHKTTLVQQKAPPPPVNKPNKGLQVKQNLLQKNVQQKAAPKPAPTPPKPAVATPKAILPMKGRVSIDGFKRAKRVEVECFVAAESASGSNGAVSTHGEQRGGRVEHGEAVEEYRFDGRRRESVAG